MGSKSSKKLIDNKIDPLPLSGSIENIEFNKVDRLVKKQPSNLSNGFNSEISDLIIDDVMTTSDSDSISSSDNEINYESSRDQSNLSENFINRNKLVRFCDKVMVITTSDANRFSFENETTSGKNFQMVQIYFINLNDDKYTKGKKQIKFEPRIQSNKKLSPRVAAKLDENFQTLTEFNQLRSWNMTKENTFYGLEVH